MAFPNAANRDTIALRRERVSQLRLRGLSAREIARALAQGDNRIVNPGTGMPYDHKTILSDLEALKEEWHEARIVNTDTHVDRQFAEMQEIKRAGWASKDPELALKALRDEMSLLGTKKPQELNINVNIEIIYRIIELAESMNMNASEVFETALRRLDHLKKLQDANG
jgi:hypothetical protein